jgi:hypothetical protein
MLTCRGDRRSAEISDLFTFEFKGKGPTQCMPLIFQQFTVLLHKKTFITKILHKKFFITVILQMLT